MTRDEAVGLLTPLGQIAKVQPLDPAVQARHRLPPSMLVSYAMYDARRDVVKVSLEDPKPSSRILT